jgi:DNA-binding transcriptional MerR regulator
MELLVNEVAKILGCHENTVRNLERRGAIKSSRNQYGYRVFKVEDVFRLRLQQHKRKCALQ